MSDLLLELLNTTPVVEGVQTELLDGRWMRDHAAGNQTVADARRLRDDLQRVVRGEVAPTVLASYLRGATRTPAVADDGITWTLNADWPARMVLAWGELQADMPGRLRPCANDECRLFLLDRSRSGTGRWCSMSECGNRMKARRHYSRARRNG
ncbi:CGNR zinc finger domain-containing protein [Mycolicibacterium arenosum]|uniref:CGNR zinc finger domain-containing protein n=1 Tax=Mycolicibacterium arenosum TaxID=2952157 RepID=A0ABT1M8J6_9MYCO|nr:CGNR zinc finger domain-containing protein [Mycolicibacterium sp. CAU 1645]MCP9275500.1 CGNR zinc finger domain-containing protein [Mycolicibacterium sp. CAU 1645]